MRLVNYWVLIGSETLNSPKPTKKPEKNLTNVHWDCQDLHFQHYR